MKKRWHIFYHHFPLCSLRCSIFQDFKSRSPMTLLMSKLYRKCSVLLSLFFPFCENALKTIYLVNEIYYVKRSLSVHLYSYSRHENISQ